MYTFANDKIDVCCPVFQLVFQIKFLSCFELPLPIGIGRENFNKLGNTRRRKTLACKPPTHSDKLGKNKVILQNCLCFLSEGSYLMIPFD